MAEAESVEIRVRMSFKKHERSYETPRGWRLATYKEVEDGMEEIKKMEDPLKEWERARLLDGWISGPGYNYQMGNDFRSCLGYMIVTQAKTTDHTSGRIYKDEDISLSHLGKEAALLLCMDDWNLEVVYWLINTWAKEEIMDLRSVTEGKVPVRNATKFEEMNSKISEVARKLGNEGPPASDKSEKTKFSGADSVKDVLSGMIEIVKDLKLAGDDDEPAYWFGRRLESCFPSSLKQTWVTETSSAGGESWNLIGQAFWSFVSDSFACFIVELSASSRLRDLYKVNTRRDLNRVTESEKNFMVAISILSYLSQHRASIIHAPLSHKCRNSCVKKVLCDVANGVSNDGPAKLENFQRILHNNAMWKCYEKTGNYGLLDKLLILAARGMDPDIMRTKKVLDSLLVNTLLKCGARPEATFNYKKRRTALQFAAKLLDEDAGMKIAESLLAKCDEKQGEELANAADWKGWTALHRASSMGHARICELLLQYRARLNVKDQYGRSPLHFAVKEKKSEVINVLMESPHFSDSIDLEDNGRDIPLDTLAKKDIETTAKLLSKAKQPQAYISKMEEQELEQILRQSLVKGYTNIVETLFAMEEKVQEAKESALHLAVKCEDESKARKMVDIIIKNKNEENRKKFVAKCESRGRTALHDAVLNGHYWLSKNLLKINPEIINIKDRDGRNPLFDAVEGKNNNPFTLRRLLRKYLETNESVDGLIDCRGLTPLHVAAWKGKRVLVEELLGNEKFKEKYRKNADVLGQTALHKAAIGGHRDTVKVLLKNGAKPFRERDCNGRTALHYAVQAKQGKEGIKLAKLLVDKCGSPERKLLFLWASAVGFGTAEEKLSDPLLQAFLLRKKKKLSTEVREGNLLKTAATLGDIEITIELLQRGCQIADIEDQDWRSKLQTKEKNEVDKVLSKLEWRQLEWSAEQENDQPTTIDRLGRLDYVHGVTALLLNPSLKPPIAVGISGTWGMGKSSFMIQIESILLKRAAQLRLLSNFASDLPGAQRLEFSKDSATKYNEIVRWVEYQKHKIDKKSKMWKRKEEINNEECFRSQHGDSEDFLVKFLNNYDTKYHRIFKSLAVAENKDIFTMKGNQFTEQSQVTDMTNSTTEASVPAILAVRYNAWRYKNDTEALAGLAVEITKEMEGIMTRPQRWSTCCRNTWRMQKQNIWIDIFFPSLLIISLASFFALIVWLILDRYKMKGWAKTKYSSLPVAAIIIVWTVVKSVMTFLKPVSSQLTQYISLPNHSEKLGYQERVISDITFLKDEIGNKPYCVFTAFEVLCHLIAELKRWIAWLFSCPKYPEGIMAIPKAPSSSHISPRIIVFVDDLDRCQESVVLQVLSAINLVLAVCEINVVLGMDKALIERSIQKKFGDMKTNRSSKASQELAEKYMQKIIQLPLDLPDPGPEQSKRFLERQLRLSEGKLDEFQIESKDNNSEADSDNNSEAASDNNSEADTDSDVDNEVEEILREEISTSDGGSLSRSNPSSHTRQEAQPEKNALLQVTIQSPTERDISDIDSGQTSLHLQTAREAPANRETRITSVTHVANRISNRSSNSSIPIRDILFTRYSERELEAFCYFQKLATSWRKLPREWKRFLTYHRLVRNIFSVSNEAECLVGWNLQLITWVFICWEWQANMNILIEEWNNIEVLKSSDGPSLGVIVKHFIQKHESKDKEMIEDNENSKPVAKNVEDDITDKCVADSLNGKRVIPKKLDNTVKIQPNTLETALKELEKLKKEITGMREVLTEKTMVKKKMKLEDMPNWQRLSSALDVCDVSMDGIQAFQRFRFYCKAGHLLWPLPKQQN